VEQTAFKTDLPLVCLRFSVFGHKYHPRGWAILPNSLHTTLILFLYFHYRLRPSHSSLSFISSFPLPSSHLYISHSSHFTNYQSIVDQYTQSNKKPAFHSHTLTQTGVQSWVYRSMTLSHSSSQFSSTSSFERFVPVVHTKCQSRDL